MSNDSAVMEQLTATAKDVQERRFQSWVAEEFSEIPDEAVAMLKDAHLDGAAFGMELMSTFRNPYPDALAELLGALKEMCEEFRQYDLPYGSAAYLRATNAIGQAEKLKRDS